MKGYVANTDFDWYSFLQSKEDLDEVNFWQPHGGRGFHAVSEGSPFLFKLKKPHYAIAGFGLYTRQSILPDWLAWEAFEQANGAPDYDAMRRRIEKYRKEKGSRAEYQVGCLMVCQPVFFARDEWIEQPRDWAKNIVQGKTYDLTVGEGRRIWEACLARAKALQPESVGDADELRFGTPQWVAPRLGQGTFRVAVTDAYARACAVTTEHSLPVLEAAHIRPYAAGGEHRVSNGLLLRTDIHRLFDKGYATITTDHRFEVSNRLKEVWANGRTYYPLHGREIELPRDPRERPDPSLLAWHNERVFRG